MVLDLVLYDWRLPDGGGPRGLMAICQLLPLTPVVFANEDPDVIAAALSAGARGYIPKSASTGVINSALQLVLQGEIYVPSVTLVHWAQASNVTATWRADGTLGRGAVSVGRGLCQ